MLALTIVTTTSSNSYSAFPTPGANNDDGFDAPFDNAFGGNRETVVTQEIPVRVLPPDIVANLHEPHTRDPEASVTGLQSWRWRTQSQVHQQMGQGPG
jgi:HUS1 checkpoint protein